MQALQRADPVELKLVLFDLDGTLLHSAPDLAAALNHVRTRHDLAPLSTEELQESVSRGAIGLLDTGMPQADEETRECWKAELLDYYQAHSCERSHLYDGVSALLRELEAKGLAWGVVTNKVEYLTHPILETLGLDQRAAAVVCGDTVSRSKPHPDPVLFACEQAGVPPQHSLYVGDDIRDIQAGEAAGTATCAVLYGYGSDALRQASAAGEIRPTFSISAPQQLAALIGLGPKHSSGSS